MIEERVNVRCPLEKYDKYYSKHYCPSDYHLNKDELVSKVHDSIKLWEIRGNKVHIDLAISHLLNLKYRSYKA